MGMDIIIKKTKNTNKQIKNTNKQINIWVIIIIIIIIIIGPHCSPSTAAQWKNTKLFYKHQQGTTFIGMI